MSSPEKLRELRETRRIEIYQESAAILAERNKLEERLARLRCEEFELCKQDDLYKTLKELDLALDEDERRRSSMKR